MADLTHSAFVEAQERHVSETLERSPIAPEPTSLPKRIAEKGLERRDLAVELDVTEDTIRRLENPATEIPSKYIPTLADLVGSTRDHLMGWDRQPIETEAA